MFRLIQRIRTSRPVGVLRYHLYQFLLSFPKRHACNLCCWTGRRFLTYLPHRHVLCPRCGSQVRHRLVAAALSLPEAAGIRLDGGNVLHLAPEYCLASILRLRARHYVQGDYLPTGVDVRVDVERLGIDDERFDIVVACDVLEHVADDERAFREIRRVLAPGGTAIVTVPQADGLMVTVEDSSITDPAERERVFGQADHVRNYGDDFAARLSAAGFDVTTVAHDRFPPDLVAKHVLYPPERSRLPLGWNDRKIFLGRRVETPPIRRT